MRRLPDAGISTLRLPAHKCSQHSGARGVADEGRDLDHVGGGNHVASYRGNRSLQSATVRQRPNQL